MSLKTKLCNSMLVRLGVTKEVGNVDTEKSPAAIAFRNIFDEERDYILRDFPWNWAKSYSTLALVSGSETASTNLDWTYAYRLPSDCVYARRLVVFRNGRVFCDRFDTSSLGTWFPPSWEIGSDNQGGLLFTNDPDATLEYTRRVEDISKWDAIFVSAFKWRMAMLLAGPLSKIKGIVDTCAQQYEGEIDNAKRHVLNERQDAPPPESEFERSRY